MAQLDDGVLKLDEFNALLADTNNQLQADRSSLGSLEDAMEKFEQTLDATLGRVDSAQARFLADLDAAAHGAEEALRTLTDSVRALRQEQLGGAQEEVVSAESTVRERVDADCAALREAFDEAESRGFAPLDTTLEESASEAADLAERLDQAFDEVVQAADEGGRHLEQALGALDSDLTAAAATVAGGVQTGLASETAECASGWSEELPDTLQAQCAEVGAPLEQAYAEFESDAVDTAAAVVQEFTELADEGARFVDTEVAEGLDDAVGGVAGDAMDPLGDELHACRAVIDVGEDLARDLEPLVKQLAVAGRVVEQVDELLNAVEG